MAVLGWAPASLAADGESAIVAGVTAGTLGIGPELAWRIEDHVALRANATFFAIQHRIVSSDLRFDTEADLRSAGLMLDLYPFGKGLRLSGGVRFNGNRARATAGTTQPSYEINDRVYTAEEIGTLSTTARPRSVSPVATIGYEARAARHLVLAVEAGVLFQRRIRVDPLSYTGTLLVADELRSAELRSDIAAERTVLEGEVDRLEVYPVVQLSAGYRF